jgi:hypothetical protein
MFPLALLALALAEPVEPVQPALPAPAGGLPPTQMLASIDGAGQLRLTCVSAAPCEGPGVREQLVPLPGAGGPNKLPNQVKVKVSTLIVTTVEIAAKHVEAYTIDGRPIAAEKLATLLAKERSVLVAADGKKVDPFLLQLYKEDTIILVPPANALPTGPGGFGAVSPLAMPLPIPAPAPLLPGAPQKEPDEKPDEKPQRAPRNER